VRSVYGWTDDYILDNVEVYGIGWLEEAYKMCREGKQEYYRVMSVLFPLARTAMDRKSGRAMSKYAKQIKKYLVQFAPWKKLDAYRAKKRLKSKGLAKLKPGEMAVMISPGEDEEHPLFKDSKIIKKR